MVIISKAPFWKLLDISCLSEIVFASNKKISENHMKFYYIFPLQTYNRNWT